jgi:hypothetical protein
VHYSYGAFIVSSEPPAIMPLWRRIIGRTGCRSVGMK